MTNIISICVGNGLANYSHYFKIICNYLTDGKTVRICVNCRSTRQLVNVQNYYRNLLIDKYGTNIVQVYCRDYGYTYLLNKKQ